MSSNEPGGLSFDAWRAHHDLARQLAYLSDADLRRVWAYIRGHRRIWLHWTYDGWRVLT